MSHPVISSSIEMRTSCFISITRSGCCAIPTRMTHRIASSPISIMPISISRSGCCAMPTRMTHVYSQRVPHRRGHNFCLQKSRMPLGRIGIFHFYAFSLYSPTFLETLRIRLNSHTFYHKRNQWTHSTLIRFPCCLAEVL